MKILVTGGAGYIATHTVVVLLEKGYEVVAVDNFVNSCPEAIARVEKITGKKVAFIEGDCCDIKVLRSIFAKYKIDAVIHFAGLKAVGESVDIPLKYYRNNIDSTLTLLEAMAEFKVNKFVFSSSATVYGVPVKLPLDENSPCGDPTNPYGATKLFIERILADYAHANKDFHAVSLRYFNPVGSHPSGLIGEDPQGIPNNLMPYVAQVAVGKLPYLSVYGDDYDTPDGTGVRDYIHIMDLAEGHISALERVEKFNMEYINLGTGIGYSVLDMVKSFEKASGKKVPYKIVARRAGDIARCYACPKKAEKVLGWKAKRNLDDMCASLWLWQSKNPKGFNK